VYISLLLLEMLVAIELHLSLLMKELFLVEPE
jgi:hypothetical protein